MRDMYYEYNYMDRIEEHRIQRIARAKQVRRNKLLLITGICITILMICLFSINAYANVSTNNESASKRFKSVQIYCGDTLDSIADEYISDGYTNRSQLINEICNINHISNNEVLIAGNYIVVPYYYYN